MFAGGGSAETLFEVVDFPFQLDDLVFLFVEEVGEVKVPGSSFKVFSGEFNPSSEESVEFVFEQEESAVEVGSLLSLNGDGPIGAEVVALEAEDGVFKTTKESEVCGSGENLGESLIGGSGIVKEDFSIDVAVGCALDLPGPLGTLAVSSSLSAAALVGAA